jgi:hypothetical protein
MEMNRLTREADELIRKVVARYNTLYSASGSISQVELDLLLDDLRQMYDKFKTISQINVQYQHLDIPKSPKIVPESTQTNTSSPPAPSHNQSITENSSTPQTPGLIHEEVTKEISPEPVIEEKKEEPVIKQENLKEEPTATIQEVQEDPVISGQFSQKEAFSKAVTPEKENLQNGQTIADRFKNDQKSISDVMSTGASKEGSLGARLGHSTVADLKSVIGLAEKFAFINELFNGDPLAYEKAIVQLNGSSHLTEAETYLATLRLNNRWPADSPLVHLLYDMVRRKFNT